MSMIRPVCKSSYTYIPDTHGSAPEDDDQEERERNAKEGCQSQPAPNTGSKK
jgi:hypothetical protein